ncbi:UDP-2,3-diacylglucosamine diphosphatase [Aquincola sp. S2]|uniref:UDP-2,3-diacylglucosamine hydrolase n=1 Tax=Pseudaquabacterium terrae TaxID=2732868 RepID=A0ABX2EMJ4_9BURK|nr:UDP-2,3-diacylglucosamine diphosphatase [Aquabacterium terrae]NRF69744.1 UDP-2,3-diacylglucosamine diphosphatase [Aquabacterium terrae]
MPAPGELHADPAWDAIDLLSDVHLHAAMPRTFEVWRRHLLTTPADAVLMLGDLFEVWVGDDARFDGFEKACADVLREAAAKRVLGFLPGNRDFLVGDTLLRECGVMRLQDPTLLQAWGQRLLLTHGDALCLADTAYQQFRSQVRGEEWQGQFLALPLAERQAAARAMRDASAAHQAGMPPDQWADVDAAAAADWLAQAGTDCMVHGHTHRPAVHALPGGRRRHVLGDWDLDGPHPRALALRLTRAGLATLDLAHA